MSSPISKPVKPRRPRTAYNLFFRQARKIIQHEHFQETGKKATYVHLSQMVSSKWKNLDKHEKAFYEELAAKDKRRYALELVASSSQRQEPDPYENVQERVNNQRGAPPAVVSPTTSESARPGQGMVCSSGFQLPTQNGFSGFTSYYYQERSINKSHSQNLALPSMATSLPYNTTADDLRHHLTHLLQHPQVPGMLAELLNGQQVYGNFVNHGMVQPQPTVPTPQERNTLGMPSTTTALRDPSPPVQDIDDSLESTFDEEAMHRLESSFWGQE